jgi:hypothetical protein
MKLKPKRNIAVKNIFFISGTGDLYSTELFWSAWREAIFI